MKPIGIKSKDFGCCPGHDKVPYKDEYETKRGKRDRRIRRKKKLTRYWKRAFKNKIKPNEDKQSPSEGKKGRVFYRFPSEYNSS